MSQHTLSAVEILGEITGLDLAAQVLGHFLGHDGDTQVILNHAEDSQVAGSLVTDIGTHTADDIGKFACIIGAGTKRQDEIAALDLIDRDLLESGQRMIGRKYETERILKQRREAAP